MFTQSKVEGFNSDQIIVKSLVGYFTYELIVCPHFGF